jgi:hypothetical protein
MKLLIIALFIVSCLSAVADLYNHNDLLDNDISLVEIVIKTSTNRGPQIVAEINSAKSKLANNPNIKFLDHSYFVK